MSNSRTRIPSPARSMPLTPRRRETPRKTRSVCSPARSNASSRISCVIREHREQTIGSFNLSPLTRRSVLTDNTDIEVPGRKSWWRDLDENSRDVMEVLKDNIVEPHDIFENIEIQSQEEKRFTLDALDSSNSESIQSIVIPQRKLFYEKENDPQKKFNQFGTRETLEKLQKTAGDKTVITATKELFRTEPRSRPVFPAALLDISANTTASEKTVTTVVETKGRLHNFFNNQQKKNQTNKRKNMFAKFIASDSEEELPEIQPKIFALQKKSDSRRPSLSSRGVDTSMTSSMDIELDDWQLLPSSTMVDHQLNTTLTAGQKPKRSRLSMLSKAETGSNGSDSSKTKSNKSIKSPERNTSIVTRNNSKTFKVAGEEINKSQNKSLSSSNTSQSSIVTRSKNKSDVDISINKSRNSNKKSKNASKASIKQTDIDDENAVNKSVSVSQNQNMDTDNKGLENEFKKPSDNDDELNFTLEYENDNADEVDEGNTSKDIATIKSNKDVNTSKNTSQKDFDSKGTSKIKISLTDKKNQNTEHKVIEESAEISETNKSHMSTRSKDEGIINDENANENKIDQDENVDKEMLNKSKKSHDQSKKPEIEDGNNDSMEQNQEIQKESGQEDNDENEIENDQVDSADEQIENGQEESEDEENDNEKSMGKQIGNELEETVAQQIENEREESEDEQNEIENNQPESADEQIENEQKESEDEQNEIEKDQQKSADEQIENEQEKSADEQIENEQEESADEQIENEQEESEDEQNEIENDQEESVDEQNEIENAQEESADEQNEIENNQEESEDEQNTSQEEIDQIESEVDDQEMECEEANESTKAESDQDDYHENDDHIENQQIDSSQENVMESEDANESIEATAVSGQNYNQENESDQHDDDDQIETTETPNVSHDTTGRNRKKTITPEAILRNSRNEVDLTTFRGRNTSVRKTKSMIQHLNMRPSLEPARKSMESSDGTRNSSADGSGWDSHRTTRKTLRQTFGKDFTPRKSLRALVMEKSAKRRVTAVNDVSVARPQANSTEFPEPELSTNDYEMLDDPPAVHEVSIRTRQATIVECLKRANMEWAEENAKVEEEVRRRLEQGRIRIQDPFKIPAQPKFPRAVSKPKPKAKKPLQSLIPLEHLPEEFIEDLKYKPPKRFAPRNAAWLTKRLYKYLEMKLQPKYDYKARIRAEKFAQMLYEFVQSLRRRGAPDVAPPHAVEELKHEMARLNFVKTHYDFYNFFHEFMPREVRIKIIPDIVNKIPHPRTGVFSDIL